MSKKANNIYHRIVNIDEIHEMYENRIKKNTQNKEKILKFEYNYVANVAYIKKRLEQKNYKQGKYNIFIIKEPKYRLIMSQNIIDKTINHLVSEHFILKEYEKTLIEQNVATRKNKGTHYAIKLLKNYINKLKSKKFYILKFDIKKYFYNLDHEILKELMRKKIKDKDVLKLLDNIIDSTDEEYINKEIQKLKKIEIKKTSEQRKIEEIKEIPLYKKGKGLPIGNMSSQALAIIYLNELDHYIKENLKIKYYIRYMDDGIILHENKKYLQYCLKEIENILKKYKLELNIKKTKIHTSTEGFEFLGFRYYIKNNKLIMKVTNKTKKRFKKKMKNFQKLLDKKEIQISDCRQVVASYLGHLSYGNTRSLIRNKIPKIKNQG